MKKNIAVLDFNEDEELQESTATKFWEKKISNPNPSNPPSPQRKRSRRLCNEKRVEMEGSTSRVEPEATVVDRPCVEDSTSLVTETAEEESGTRDDLKETDAEDVTVCLNTEDDVKETDDDGGLKVGLNSEDGEEESEEDDDDDRVFGLNTEDDAKEMEEDDENDELNTEETDVDHGLEPGTSSYGRHQQSSSDSESSSSEEENNMMSAVDESLSDQSALSQDSDSEGDEASDSEADEDWVAEHYFNDEEKIDRNTTVIMTPEYVVLKDTSCAESLVMFSSNGIKIKSYLADNEEGPFSCEFETEDIVSIRYKWHQTVGLIILRIRVLLKDEKCHDDMQQTTDIEELKFAVKEQNWPEKQQEINSLHVKYPAVWNAGLDDDVEVSGDNLHRRKRYFPSFVEPFEDVIYPKGDPDAVSICKRDVELLQPETFVNDTIIDFYINYLKNQIQVEEKQRLHFFNSFFFRKLADLDKDPSSIADGKAAFLRVRKWTRKVDMFGKDYIFVPVNFNLHWSLIVICHPGETANCTDLDLDGCTKVPCILHMDSIKGSHAGLKNLIQSYLCEEWKERHKETSDEISSRFMNLRFVSLELPQQENSFDCGLFLLHYLELFLAEAPDNFSPFEIDKTSKFLYLNWFPPAEASLKRTLIQKLIFELLENRSREVSDEDDQSCESPVHVSTNTGIEVLSERCNPLIDCNGNMTQTQDDHGIEMTLLEQSTMRNVQPANDSSMVLRDLFDSGANNTGSLLGQLQQTLEEPSSFFHLSNGTLAGEQVDIETGEQFMCLNTGEGNFQRSTGTSPRASMPFSSWNLGIMPVPKEGETDMLSDTSNGSEDIGIIEDDIPMEDIHKEETGESPLRETVSLFSETIGPNTNHIPENDEFVSSSLVPLSQDDRDEKKPLQLNLDVGDKTSDDLGIENKTNDVLENGGKASDDLVNEDKTSDVLGIGDKASDVVGIIADKAINVLENEDKTTEDLGFIADKSSSVLEYADNTSKDVGDDCIEEERAAKRPKLISTGEEVNEMER